MAKQQSASTTTSRYPSQHCSASEPPTRRRRGYRLLFADQRGQGLVEYALALLAVVAAAAITRWYLLPLLLLLGQQILKPFGIELPTSLSNLAASPAESVAKLVEFTLIVVGGSAIYFIFKGGKGRSNGSSRKR